MAQEGHESTWKSEQFVTQFQPDIKKNHMTD